MNIGGYEFNQICELELKRGKSGNIQTDRPQARYRNKNKIALNSYGKGCFCKFRIIPELKQCGVYVILIEGKKKYVGECRNLAARYNNGYGQISPRNCFVKGQPTNCRINKMILAEASKGKTVKVLFFQTSMFKKIERELISIVNPPWNRKRDALSEN